MDSFARPIMWNIPHAAEIIFYAMIPVVLVLLAAGVAWRVRKWFLGTPEPGSETVWQRLKRIGDVPRLKTFIKTAIFQSRIGSDAFAFVMHQAIFWGMVVLAIGTALATVDQDFANLLFDRQILSGGFYQFFELAMDLFGVLLILGVLMAAYRRYLVRPPRLKAARTGISRWDKFPFLTTLALIALTGFVVEGLRLAEGRQWEAAIRAASDRSETSRLLIAQGLGIEERFRTGEERQNAELRRIAAGGPAFPAAAWAPVGNTLGKAFAGLPTGTIRAAHQVLWWGHGMLAFGLILAIPFTKAFHLFSTPANMLLRNVAPVGRLPVAAESGVRTVRDFTWRQLLQIDACTWCGRCQDACPGHNTGFPLSPRDFIQAIGSQLIRTPAKANGDAADLHESLIPAAQLWACCTCRACEEVCPAMIQQPRAIIDMRRRLVDQGQIDEGLQDALMNVQRYGNSFGQSPRKRPEWAKPLDFKLKDARKEEAEYLWYVGDYASYDQRAQEVTRAIARVFRRAGLDVGLLQDKEQNAGNDVRRVGEEGLFGMLREKMLKELGTAKFRRVVTTDPHTYNTLKNEYAGNGAADGNGHDDAAPLANKPVVHYTELLDELIGQGKLPIERSLKYTVTYHDPCYLGRFNGVYDAPRRVLAALGVKLIEMPRCRENSFCCGAGGGRIWMKDTPGIEERPAENRVREALSLPGVQCLVVACPKDLVMFQDAVKTVGAEDRLRVVDLGELVYEALGAPAEVAAPVGEQA
jgi:Fe-S oxidoreductase/nitrate reductase gamma subunit